MQTFQDFAWLIHAMILKSICRYIRQKNELNIYVYKGGYFHAWRKPEERIEKIRIDLVEPKMAAVKMLEAYTYIENMAKEQAHGKC